MDMVFRYSEQVEKCHYGQKSDIHFQLSQERLKLLKQKTISNTTDVVNRNNKTNTNRIRNKKLQKSNTYAEQCIRSENFYCNAQKLSIFDDNKCSVVLLGISKGIEIYHNKCIFAELKNHEPDAILPYHQIKMIQFYNSIEDMNNGHNSKSFTIELNSHIEVMKPKNYIFTYSNEHIVSATLYDKTLPPYNVSNIELSDDSCSSVLNNKSPIKTTPHNNFKCILSLWYKITKCSNKSTKYYNNTTNKMEMILLSSDNINDNALDHNRRKLKNKLHLNTTTKKCYFQTRAPIHNINLNTSELFQDQIIPINQNTTTATKTMIQDEFIPAKPHELTYTYMIIYLNPDFNISNGDKQSTLNLYDLRFQIPSYSAILLKRFINSTYSINKNIPINRHYTKLDPINQEYWVDNTEIHVPPIDIRSKIMTNELYIALSGYLPPSSIYQQLVLVYSSDVHGTSIKTLYRNCHKFIDEYGILLIKENTGNIFGAVISQLPKISKYYYGNGSSSVFRYEPNCQFIKNFKWSGRNSYIIKGDLDSISIGGGKTGASIWLNEDLVHGRTHISETFMNEQLSDKENFVSIIVELWTFDSN